MTPARLLLRADANASLGLGHVGRTYALGETFGERLEAVPELLAHADPVLDGFREGKTMRLIEVHGEGYAVDEIVPRLSPSTVLVSDSYAIDEAALDAVAATGARHVVIDDFAVLRRWPVDLVVNPNMRSERFRYRGAGWVLSGPRYALLRSEIAEVAVRRRIVPERASNVLVCLGGGDWPERGRALLDQIAEIFEGQCEIRATVPPRQASANITPVPARLLHEQFAWADVALLSGGTLKYEAAACGLPALLVAVVPHQVAVSAAFARTGAARALGPLDSLDLAAAAWELAVLAGSVAAREAMARAGRRAVDGKGARRAVDVLLAGGGCT